jgi:group I intron endonuclease
MLYKWHIYKIESPSGRVYIGKTSRLKKRMTDYNCLAATVGQKMLHSSIKKYGWDAHTVSIIDEFEASLADSNSKEMFWIRTYMSNCIKYPEMNGMNLTDGGGGCIGYKWSDDAKKALSLKKKANKKEMLRMLSGLRTGTIGAYKGQKRPDWVGRKISKGSLGKKFSDIHKENLSISHKGKDSPKRKSVIKYNMDGVKVGEFKSFTEAANSMGGSKSAMNNVINGKSKSYKGYIFKFKEVA